ncbi:MAG: PAS domain S-box protein [Planctomycetota bacterium]|jgi:PAS domain S-box-containing protein
MHDSGSSGKKSIPEVEQGRRNKLKTERLKRRDAWQKKFQATIGVDMPQAARRTGIDILGDVHWGTHLCAFYQDKQDLIDILVPYFKAGLENNEFCMWITSEPLSAGEAEESLRRAVNNLDDYIEKGQIEILDYNQWYTKAGNFDADKVIQGWMGKYEQTGKRQFEGLRITGNTLWLQKKDWRQFAEYERTIDDIVNKNHMLVICTYCLDTCETAQVVDVVSSHKCAIIKRQGNWELVENSELRNTNRALQNALQQWKTTFNTTQDSIILIDPDFTILKANQATSKLLSKPLDEILGSKCYELFHGTKEASDICPHKKAKETKKHEETELYISEKDIWLAISTDPILDDDGDMSGSVHVVRDVTARKRAEKAFRENQEKMRSLLELSPDFIIIVNPDHTIQFINRVAPGDSVERVIGKSVYEFVESRYHGDLRKAISQTFATGQSCNLVVRGIYHTGKMGWFEDRLAPIKKNGSVSAVMIVCTDITKRKKAEEELKQSREFLNNTINALDDSFFIKDEEHRWTVFNDAACKAIGHPREELIGKSDYDIFPKEQADVFWEKDNLVFETGETSINEEEITWQGKLHTISTKKSLFKDSVTGKRYIVGTVRDITERRQMEKTLRESEQKYRALVEQSIHGIVILQDYGIVFANKKAAEIAGLTVDEVKSLSLEEMMAFIPPEDREDTLERFKNRLAGKKEPENYEIRIVRRNGEEFWLNMFFSNIEYQGKFAVQVTFVDITDQKRMEEALRRSEKRFREFFENTAVGIYRTTPDGRILMANPALVNMLGYSLFEDITQRNLEEEGFEPQYLRSRFKEEIERKERIVSWESIWTTREGNALHVIENARVVKDEEGNILYYEGTAENITERKKAEEALIESEEKFRSLAEQSPNMIFINQMGRVVYANEKCEEVMGYKREEFYHPDFDFMTLIAPEFRQLIRTNLGRHMKGEEIKPYEYGLITKDGERLDTIITTKLMKYGGENSILGIITDITEHNQAQEEITKLAKFPAEDPNPVLRISKDGTILYANSASSIVLDTWDRKVGERLPEGCRERIDDVFSSGKASTFEFQCDNGQIFEVKLAPVVESGYANAYGLDITERKQAVEKLRQREQTLRAFRNAPTVSAILVDTEGIIMDVNRIAAQRLGKSAGELIGMGMYDYLPDDVAEYRKTKGAEVIRSGKPLRFQDERAGRYYDNNIYPVFDDEGNVNAFAVFSGDITEHKLAEERVYKYQEQLKSLASQLTLAEERERRRIAIELHDEISQSLFISKIKLEELQKSGPDKTFDDTLNEINASLGRIITSMRSLIFDLSSPVLYELGFEEAVAEWLTEQVERKYDIATEFEDDGLPKPLDDDIRVILFRNVRELLINVVKHAQAKKIKVSIQKMGSRISISVEDDGVGFDSASAESLITGKNAFGLFSIRERLEHLGGNLEIDSSPGCGCRITITSPLKQENISKEKQG